MQNKEEKGITLQSMAFATIAVFIYLLFIHFFVF